MREQQVHPPLAAALPVILEHHKGSLQGDVPSTAQAETVTCGMCLSTQGCTQISGSNKTTLLFSHCPAPHSGLWHLTPILSCASRTWSLWKHPTGPAAAEQGPEPMGAKPWEPCTAVSDAGAQACTGNLWQEHIQLGLRGHTDVLKTRQSRRWHSAPCVGITGTTAPHKNSDEPPVPRRGQKLQCNHSSGVTLCSPVPRAGC